MWFVGDHLHGAKNGKRSGMTSSIVVKGVEITEGTSGLILGTSVTRDSSYHVHVGVLLTHTTFG